MTFFVLIAAFLAGWLLLRFTQEIRTFGNTISALLGLIVGVVFGVVGYHVFYRLGASALFSLVISIFLGWLTLKEVRASLLSHLSAISEKGDVTKKQLFRFFAVFTGCYLLVPLLTLLADWLSVRFGILLPSFVALTTGFVTYGIVSVYFLNARSGFFSRYFRGRKLIHADLAKQNAAQARGAIDTGIYWGGLYLPTSLGTSHFCVAGVTGSGKTVLLRLLMQSVLPEIGRGNDQRALIYDPKQDMLSILSGMSLSCEVLTLNPFDTRSVAWDIAADVSSRAAAETIASILIPASHRETQPFFSEAAQDLLVNVLVSFVRHSPGAWNLRDVVLALREADLLRMVLERDELTRPAIERYFKPKTTFQNIMSTVGQKMRKFETVAALWEHATRKVSLEDWVKNEYVLILGTDESLRAAIDPINQAIFKRASELLLRKNSGSKPTRRSWVIFDELGKAGRLSGLSGLLTQGRSYGACVVLGLQDIDSLTDTAVYGPNEANVILGQCANKAFLNLESEPTARWAASLIGETELFEYTTSNSTGSSNQGWSESQTVNEQLVKREAVLASELLGLPLPSERNPVVDGYFVLPSISSTFRGQFRFDDRLVPLGPAPGFVGRSPDQQFLRRWDEEDFRRLRLTNRIPAQSAPKTNESVLSGFGRMDPEDL